MKNILKTIVSLILVVALLLTATSCAVNGVADEELKWDLVNKKGQTRMEYINGKHGPNAPVNPAKPEQTFFNDDPAGIINKAWGMKGNGVCRTEGANTVYEIKMPYPIGTKGETTVRIIVMTETNQLVNSYPIVLP